MARMSDFNSPMFSYAEAETALAFSIDATKQQRGTLRARLKHLQRLNLLGLKSGRGQRLVYSRAQVVQLMLALILAQAGLDPTLIVTTIKRHWRELAGQVQQAASRPALSESTVTYLVLWSRAMTAAWESKPPIALQILDVERPVTFAIAPLGPSTLLKLIDGANNGHWISFYYLTRALQRLDIALSRRG
jgi:hypothetical protein